MALLRLRRLRPVCPVVPTAPILETASRAFHRKFEDHEGELGRLALPSFVNLALVPLDYRVLFMNCSQSCDACFPADTGGHRA